MPKPFFCPHCYKTFTTGIESRAHQKMEHPKYYPVALAGDPTNTDDVAEALKFALTFPDQLQPGNEDDLKLCIAAVSTIAQILVDNGFATPEQANQWGIEKITDLTVRLSRALTVAQIPPSIVQNAPKPIVDTIVESAAAQATKSITDAVGAVGNSILKAPGQLAMALMPDFYAKDAEGAKILSNPIGAGVEAGKVALLGMIHEIPHLFDGSMFDKLNPAQQAVYHQLFDKGGASPDKLAAWKYAEAHPEAPDPTKKSQAQLDADAKAKAINDAAIAEIYARDKADAERRAALTAEQKAIEDKAKADKRAADDSAHAAEIAKIQAAARADAEAAAQLSNAPVLTMNIVGKGKGKIQGVN